VFLLIFESIGAPELLVILVVALIIFGPRKLPQLSRSLGKSLADFRRASDEFKRTWEREVELEETQKDERISQALLPEDNSIIGAGEVRASVVRDAASASEQGMPEKQSASSDELTTAAAIPPVDSPASQQPLPEAGAADAPVSHEPMRKRDWL
jgi:TatA/E family protein of Tat protein translocase